MALLNRNVIQTVRKTLSLVDYHLVDHGERVAYLIMKMLQEEARLGKDNARSQEEIAHACILAALHDIGAYKTEILDSLSDNQEIIHFEILDAAPHSAYGYLFLKEYTSLNGLSDAVLYHHVRYDQLCGSSCQNQDLAAKLFVADRQDLLCLMNGCSLAQETLRRYSGTIFKKEDVDLLLELQMREDLHEKLESGEFLSELFQFMEGVYLPEEELEDLLRLLAYAIDFRSSYTVTHTITTVGVAMELAERLNFPPEEIKALRLGSILHDVGKIVTPLSILEKPGKLTPEEYAVMKTHVTTTEKVLHNCLDNHIVEIAARHHEKLDGSGYPHGLRAEDLTPAQRLLAVADMTSALAGRRSYKAPMPAELVTSILSKEAETGKICPGITGALIEDYEGIMERVQQRNEAPLKKYNGMVKEYPACLEELRKYLPLPGTSGRPADEDQASGRSGIRFSRKGE